MRLAKGVSRPTRGRRVRRRASTISAVAPCFSVYADVGRYLAGTVGKYARWVETYASESFASEADKVARVLRSNAALHPEFSSQIADIVRRGIDAEIEYWNKSLRG